MAGARDSAPCQKCAKREGFATGSKTLAGVGAFEEDLQRCMSLFRGRRNILDRLNGKIAKRIGT